MMTEEKMPIQEAIIELLTYCSKNDAIDFLIHNTDKCVIHDIPIEEVITFISEAGIGKLDPINYQCYLFPIDGEHIECLDYQKRFSFFPIISFHNCHSCRNNKIRFGKPVCRKDRHRFKNWRIFRHEILGPIIFNG